ncbi:hypothetical protein [Gorillibacterium sp. sgz500922]|uniref:hypothetical protein n=1 Tax=Gorillibacterium sp. sgz500922 TaxID=3446694 RepID=UPI003F671222
MKRPSKRKTALLILSSLILLLAISLYLKTPQPVNAMFAGSSSLTPYGNRVYIDPSISQMTREQLLQDLKESEERIKGFYGEVQADPTFLFVESPKMVKRYAQNSTGQTYHLYWGDYIVVGPSGFSQDVIAHERMHSELKKRAKLDRIPAWFDEGLATLADDRFPDYKSFDAGPQDKQKLQAISKRNDFNRMSSDKSYPIAHAEVGHWFGKVGQAGLARLIDGINDGKSFDELFAEIDVE